MSNTNTRTYMGMTRVGIRCYSYRGYVIQWHQGPRAWYVSRAGESEALDAADRLSDAKGMVDYWANGGLGAGRLEVRS